MKAVAVFLFLAFVATAAAGSYASVEQQAKEVGQPMFVATLMRLAVLLVLAALSLVFLSACRRADAAAPGDSDAR